MKLIKSVLFFALLLILSLSAQAAFFVADLPSSNADPTMGTHIIVAGRGLQDGDQWLMAAQTQALIFKDRKIHGPIRIIAGIENSDTRRLIKNWGYENVTIFRQTYTGPKLVEQLLKVDKIASIDFIGHHGVALGFALENADHRFFLDDIKALSSLKTHMTTNAFIRIMGCNTGWLLAPAMANLWGVPVAGTLTSADVERFHETNQWFYDDPGFYPGGHFAVRNQVSFENSVDCLDQGGCKRLKAINTSYVGVHGSYFGTVPFSKFFCGSLEQKECFRRMAYSTQFLVGVNSMTPFSQDQFNETLADQFCPSLFDGAKARACREKVLGHLNNSNLMPPHFSTASGPTLNCNFLKCEFKTVCKKKCALVGEATQLSTTYVDELNAYKNGYQTLINSK